MSEEEKMDRINRNIPKVVEISEKIFEERFNSRPAITLRALIDIGAIGLIKGISKTEKDSELVFYIKTEINTVLRTHKNSLKIGEEK